MFTPFDVIICVIILLTSVIAFMRGGARDLLSLFTWVAAGFVTIFFYPFAYSYTEEFFVSSMTASLTAIVPLFIVSLGIFSIISATILGNMINVKLGVLDRSFGALIGFAKGLIIVSVIHFCVALVAGSEPEWLQSGETYKLTRYGAEIVKNVTAEIVLDENTIVEGADPDSLKSKLSDLFDDTKDEASDTIENIENIEMDAFEEEFISEEIID